MQLPAIREKIFQFPRSHKYLFLLLVSLSVLLIFVILIGFASFFYLGYHRESVTPKGVKYQGWAQGKRIDVIAGTVVKKAGSTITIINEGEELNLEITGKVFYCGDREETDVDFVACTPFDVSSIQEGMYLMADWWREDPDFYTYIGDDKFIRVWE